MPRGVVRLTSQGVSHDKAEAVRMPLRVGPGERRTLDQQLAVRFPRLGAASFRLIAGLSPRSRVRQAALRRAMRLALEAYNRRDLDAVVTGYGSELEYYPYREFVEAGLAEPCYRGPSGYRTYIEATYEVWGTDVRLEPTELIDMGDRLVVLADMPMRAQASGVLPGPDLRRRHDDRGREGDPAPRLPEPRRGSRKRGAVEVDRFGA